MALNLRLANENDSAEIAVLVNKAYRPSEGEAGWTHESNLVKGERISKQQVSALLHEKSVILLLCDEGNIVACVQAQGGESNAYIGMLATAPHKQANGIGKKILQHAEQYCTEHFGNSVFKMSIISSRPELLKFYERRGYALTNEIEEYPTSSGVGQPLVEEIKVLSLIKRLS